MMRLTAANSVMIVMIRSWLLGVKRVLLLEDEAVEKVGLGRKWGCIPLLIYEVSFTLCLLVCSCYIQFTHISSGSISEYMVLRKSLVTTWQNPVWFSPMQSSVSSVIQNCANLALSVSRLGLIHQQNILNEAPAWNTKLELKQNAAE